MVVEVAREEVELRPVDVALDALPVELAFHHNRAAPHLQETTHVSKLGQLEGALGSLTSHERDVLIPPAAVPLVTKAVGG